MSTTESVTAQPVDISHLSGVSYAAVQTLVQTSLQGNRIGLAMDGNGRSTSVVGIDASLSLLAQHAQVLAAHYPDQGIRDFLPGYLDPGKLGDKHAASTLVWVLS